MLSGLELTLAIAALLIGFTGTWSPCGFSMIETIGPVGHTGGRRTTIAACATFFPGTLIGGVLTFAALALVGGLVLGSTGPVAYGIAAAIALGAAALEARGTPIIPQIRRQLPEHWRRVMPMPLAAALYGVLLGLGFTTFVLSFGVWALAAVSFAIGDLQAGIVVGLAFGIGRALPIVLLAPIADRPAGSRITELMAIRPSLYRGARLGDAVALFAVAVLLGTSGAEAAREEAKPGADPGVQAGELVFQRSNGAGVLLRSGSEVNLPGTDPAIGGGYIAVLDGTKIKILDAVTLDEIKAINAGSADAIAISRKWLVHRARRKGQDRMIAREISDPTNPGTPSRIARAKRPSQLGIPSLSGGQLVYAKATRSQNRLISRRLGSGGSTTALKSRKASLSNPSVDSGRMVYVEIRKRHQRLRIRSLRGSGKGRVLIQRRRQSSTFYWSTALDDDRAYLTILRPGADKLISVSRR